MKVSATAFAFCLMLPHLAVAADYKLISSNKAQLTLADADSQISRSHNIVKLWSVILRAPDHLLPGDIAVVKMLNEFDCETNQWREVAIATYHKDDSLIKNEDLPNEHWRAVVPETQNSDLEDFACGSPAFRKSRASIGPFPLGKIISSVYAGPWPAN